MEWRSLLLVAVALVVAVVARPEEANPPPVSVKLCALEVCKCTTEEIVCKCTKNEKIEVNKDDMADRKAVTKFEIQDCTSLLIKEDAFSNEHKLQSLKVTNVKEVDLKVKDAFQDLKSVWIDKSPSLKLSKGVFAEAKNLDSIRIQESTIQELHEGDLHSKVKSLEFTSLIIQKVDKSAIKIEGANGNSTVNILKSKIGKVENTGIEILKFTNFTVENCEFNGAEKGSIVFKDLVSFEAKRNTFHADVDVESIQLASQNIIFVDNTLLNIDTSKEIKPKTGDETSHSLENIIFNHDGNAVNCKCGTGSEITGKFGNNVCVSETCKTVTLEKFRQSCKTSAGKKDDEILKQLCTPPKVPSVLSSTQNPSPQKPSPQSPSPQSDEVSDVKSRSHGSKIIVQVLPLFVVYFCSLIL